jgi:hypothetical protein
LRVLYCDYCGKKIEDGVDVYLVSISRYDPDEDEGEDIKFDEVCESCASFAEDFLSGLKKKIKKDE